MIIEHIKAPDLITTKWSGGTTTQLAIFPKEATYNDRNFLFRISTATVEAEESTFTKLPGISRKLMILDGEIKIEHQNRYSKTLKKFEQDSFEGDWDTKSYGQAVDFNLMTTGNTKSEIETIILNKNKDFRFNVDTDFYVFFVYSGKVNVSFMHKIYELNCKDVLLLIPENKEKDFKLLTKENCEVVLSKITF
jgi:environmental stress-induced protein Ves